MRHLGPISYRWARRIVVGVVGGTVLLAGVAMLVLPGPAVVVIPLGLAILGIEFAWARLWLRRVRKRSADLAGTLWNYKRGSGGAQPIGSSNSSSRTNRTGGDPYDSTRS